MRLLPLLLLSVGLSGCCIPMPSSPDPGTTAPTPPLPGPAERPTADPSAATPAAEPGIAPEQPVVPRLDRAPPISGPGFETGLDDRARRNLVPQLDDAWELFGSLTDAAGADTVTGGLLLCDLRLPGTKMFRSRPDIQGRFNIGGQPLVLANAHNNRDSAVLSVPLGTLNKGQQLKVTVMDRDLFSKDDLIDGAQTSYPGHFPLVLTGIADKLHGTCRHVDAAAVSQRLTPALAHARAALEGYETSVRRGVDLAAQDLGYPWTEHLAVERGVDGVAALMGWTQSDVAELRNGFLEGRRGWAEIAAAGAQKALAGAATVGGSITSGSVTVGPAVRLCGPPAEAALMGTPAEGLAPACVLAVTIQGAAPAVALGAGSLDLLSPDGRTTAPTVLGASGDRLLLNEAALGQPAALRLTDGRAATFLRLR